MVRFGVWLVAVVLAVGVGVGVLPVSVAASQGSGSVVSVVGGPVVSVGTWKRTDGPVWCSRLGPQRAYGWVNRDGSRVWVPAGRVLVADIRGEYRSSVARDRACRAEVLQFRAHMWR